MNSNNLRLLALLILVMAVLALQPALQAQSQNEFTLHSFTGMGDGGSPYGGVTFDAAGNLYGTTVYGGSRVCFRPGCGVVYELTPTTRGPWQLSLPFQFVSAATGATPMGSLKMDASGNIFGTTLNGGGAGLCSGEVQGCGLVYELSPIPGGGWQESTPLIFADGSQGGLPDGGLPYDGLVTDSAGNLYGTTSMGGNATSCAGFGCGVVFRLLPNGSGGWQETILHTFTGGRDGGIPHAHLIVDAAGNLYGTTSQGGNLNGCAALGCGVVFELSPVISGPWPEKVLHAFTGGSDGSIPYSGLALDASGNLYGTTFYGGRHCGGAGCGVVFELAPNGSGGWTETVLHDFTGGVDGDAPASGVTLDGAGNIYGVTTSGGDLVSCNPTGCGVVFKLVPDGSGGWTEKIRYAFTGQADGWAPQAPLTIGPDGKLYGTTASGGAFGQGVVFRVQP